MRVGLLGAGGMGHVHAQCYSEIEGARLVAVADIDHAAADSLAGQYGAEAYYDYQELLSKADVDVIDVCLPTFVHEEAVVAAAAAGRHVLCEKPIALDLAGADRMVAAVAKAGVHAMVAQVVRFTPQYAAIKDLLDRGELGRPLWASAARLSSTPRWSSWFTDPKLSGGALLDLHIHDLDYLYWLFGKPRSVFALGVVSAMGGWDHVLTTLDYGECKVTAEGGFMMPDGFPFTANFRMLGDKGYVQFPGGASGEVDHQSAAVTADDVLLLAAGREPARKPFEQRNPYQIEIEYFLRCVAEDREPELATLSQARTVLEIAMAARTSMETGRPVTLGV